MLFLLIAFALESKCKDTKKYLYDKKNLPPLVKPYGGNAFVVLLHAQILIQCVVIESDKPKE